MPKSFLQLLLYASFHSYGNLKGHSEGSTSNYDRVPWPAIMRVMAVHVWSGISTSSLVVQRPPRQQPAHIELVLARFKLQQGTGLPHPSLLSFLMIHLGALSSHTFSFSLLVQMRSGSLHTFTQHTQAPGLQQHSP
jgi:hypothetical protein